ncbi:MAG: alpha/beta hydrolase [Chitinophagaceae bacterium]|nr:alpha/beta hydrolase [Chitinophagaceae bacterium]MBX3258028.1 alpha/beta hydrolase [Chitinophagaceae bacterium]
MKHLLLLLIILVLSQQLYAQDKNDKLRSGPLVIGAVDEIYSAVLSENRALNIYLPEGYNEKDSVKYPVIYVLDGSINVNFIPVAGIVQYNTLPWVNRIPKSIVVGIANVDRNRDFTGPTNFDIDRKYAPTCGGSAKFIAFIEKELQPYMNKKYKTGASKTIVGQSFAGLLATEILFTKPTLFNKYIIVSPSLWWNDGSLLKLQPEILNETFSQQTGIYIGVGKEGLVPGHDSHVMEVDANLLADRIKQGKSKTVSVFFDYLPAEDHETVTHPAVFNAFRLLYPWGNKD